MSVIDRVRSGTTSEKDIEEINIINKHWGISGFFVGMALTLLIIALAVAIYAG